MEKSNRMMLLILCLIMGIGSIQAKNLEYEGQELTFDRPDGDLKYYKVNLSIFNAKYWGSSQSYKAEELIVPFIFNDETVYVRNLYGSNSCASGNLPVWMIGRIENDDLVFECNTATGFYFYPAGPEGFDFIPSRTLNQLEFGIIDENATRPEIVKTNATGYLRLTKNGSGYASAFNRNEGIYYKSGLEENLVVNVECLPLDIEPVTPPVGMREELYQINFKPYSSFFYTHEKEVASLRLQVVRTSDEIYIKGLSAVGSGNPDIWVKGEIEGDKVIFRNSQLLGIGRNSKPMYLTSLMTNTEIISSEWYTRAGGGSTVVSTVSLDSDLTFSYDPETGTLSNPSNDFGLPYQNGVQHQESENGENVPVIWEIDYFKDAEIIKVPEDYKYQPVSPKVDDYGRWQISYLDANGYMMDPSHMYVQVYDNGVIMPQRYLNYETWKPAYALDYPYGLLYFEYLLGVIGENYSLADNQYYSYWVTETPGSFESNLIYVGEDYIAESNPTYTSVDEIKEEISSSNQSPVIYDLTGRKVEPDRLSSGIYIINGKKVMIK